MYIFVLLVANKEKFWHISYHDTSRQVLQSQSETES